MRFILYFSGEHPKLPRAEFEAVAAGEGITWNVVSESARTLIFDTPCKDSSLLKRLALTKTAGYYVGSADDLHASAEEVHKLLKTSDSFRVKCNSENLERKLGAAIHALGHEVKLKDADCEIFKAENHIGVKIPLNRDFNKRKPQHRPFFKPTSMHPKIARLLVNLAHVKAGNTVLDPFCGTGGILIEAALMKMKVSGCDIDSKMAEGCLRNLEYYRLSGEIKNEDALSCSTPADAIVTDPPYGRSSFVSVKNSIKLYEQFIKHASEIVDSGRYMVLVAPKEHSLEFPGFTVYAQYDMRVHKSLTRRIWVLRKT